MTMKNPQVAYYGGLKSIATNRFFMRLWHKRITTLPRLSPDKAEATLSTKSNRVMAVSDKQPRKTRALFDYVAIHLISVHSQARRELDHAR